MAGNIDFGLQGPNDFYQGAANANALMQNFARRKAGALIAAGNTKGAEDALNQSGQLPEANTVEQNAVARQTQGVALDQAKRQYHTQMVHDVGTALDNVGTTQGWDKVPDAFDHLTPLFKQQGLDDASLAQLREAIVKDPQGTIAGITGNAAKELEQYKTAHVLKPGDQVNVGGKTIAGNTNPTYMSQAPGNNIIEIPHPLPGQNASPVSTDGTAPPPPTDGTAPPSPTASTAVPNMFNGAVNPADVATVESNNNPNAVGPANVKGGAAQGNMQVQTPTAKAPGFGVVPAKDDSPAERSRVGNDYIAALSNHFGQDGKPNATLGLIGYNWGPGNAQKWLDSGADFNKLPQQTQQYLGRVAVAQAQRQRFDYGAPAFDQGVPQGNQPPAAPQGGTPPAAAGPSKTGATGGPRVAVPGQPVWRSLNPQEQAKFPGAIEINANGEVKYPPASQMPSTMTDDAKNLAAQKYILTGQLPNLGFGASKDRQDILNKASNITNSLNLSGADTVALGKQFASDAASLTDMVKRRSQVASFEGTVEGSMGLVRQYAPRALANTGFSFGNRAVNWWKQATNDPKMGQLQNAINTTTNEYAKVISNASGGGVTSDAARAHAEELLNSADSSQSLAAKMDVLQQEMDIRVKSMDGQIGQLGSKLHGALSAHPNPPAVPTKGRTGTYDPKQGKVVWQ